MPKKPPRSTTVVVMAKGKPARFESEELPREQKALELSMGERFLRLLEKRTGRRWHSLAIADSEPGDLCCKTPEGEAVLIQVAECVDEHARVIDETSRTYQEAVRAALRDEGYTGFDIVVHDAGNGPRLPLTTSVAGRELVSAMIAHIAAVLQSLSDLRPGWLKRSDPVIPGFPGRFSVTFHKRKHGPIELPTTLQWLGGRQPYRVDLPRGILPRAVQTKLHRYSKPRTTFVLLIYSVDTRFSSDDPDVHEARHLFRDTVHPFTEAWYLSPLPFRDKGLLVQLWPEAVAG